MEDLQDKADRYEKYFEKTQELLDCLEEDIRITGKIAKEALAEQPVILAKWKRMYSAVYGLTEECQEAMEAIFGNKYYHFQNTQKRTWNSTEAKDITKADKDYSAMRQLYIASRELLKEIEGAISVVESRGFSLKNYIELSVKGYECMLL